jgi:glutathione S-transferase
MQSELQPVAVQIVAPLIFGAPTSRELLERKIADIKRLLGTVDTRLGQAGGWLAAGQYTLADVAHVGVVLLLRDILGKDSIMLLEGGLGRWRCAAQHLGAFLARPHGGRLLSKRF